MRKKPSVNNEIEGIKPRTNDAEVRLAGAKFKIHDGPWTSIKAHEVVIDGLNAEGRLMVRDHSEGTKYEMTMAEFKRFRCGRVAFQVRQR